MKEGWEIVNIGSICNIMTGKLDANASSENGIYPFFTCSRESLRIDNYAYDCECVLIAGNGDLNVKYYKGKFNAYQRTYIVTLKNDIKDVSVKYIFKFFEKYVEKLRQLSVGGVIKYIKLGDLTNAKIPVPSLSEQERIVEELDCLSGVIEKKKQQLKELDALAQSIFYEMFGNPVENDRGWEVKKLGEVCQIICGQDYKSVKDDNGKYPIYGTGGIMGYASQYRCPANSVIIGRKGNINNPLFVGCEFWNVDTAFGVVPDIVQLATIYFFFFCKNYDFTVHDVSVTIPSLRRVDVLKIDVACPPLSLQQQFADKIELIERQKDLIRKSIEEVEMLFNSRMEYYFN